MPPAPCPLLPSPGAAPSFLADLQTARAAIAAEHRKLNLTRLQLAQELEEMERATLHMAGRLHQLDLTLRAFDIAPQQGAQAPADGTPGP